MSNWRTVPKELHPHDTLVWIRDSAPWRVKIRKRRHPKWCQMDVISGVLGRFKNHWGSLYRLYSRRYPFPPLRFWQVSKVLIRLPIHCLPIHCPNTLSELVKCRLFTHQSPHRCLAPIFIPSFTGALGFLGLATFKPKIPWPSKIGVLRCKRLQPTMHLWAMTWIGYVSKFGTP